MNLKQKIVLIVGSIAMLTTLFFVRWTWGGEPYSSSRMVWTGTTNEYGRKNYTDVPTTQYTRPGSTISPIFFKPKSSESRDTARIDMALLAVEWFVITVLTVVLTLLLKSKPVSEGSHYSVDEAQLDVVEKQSKFLSSIAGLWPNTRKQKQGKPEQLEKSNDDEWVDIKTAEEEDWESKPWHKRVHYGKK